MLVSLSLFFTLFLSLSVYLFSFSLEMVLGLPVPCDQWVCPIKQVLIGCTNRGRSGVFKAPSWAPDVGVLIRTRVPKSVRRYGTPANPHFRMTISTLNVGHFEQLLSQYMTKKTDNFFWPSSLRISFMKCSFFNVWPFATKCYSAEIPTKCYSAEITTKCYSVEIPTKCYSVEIPTRCSFVIEFIIPKFIQGWTCFELHTAHHQET